MPCWLHQIAASRAAHSVPGFQPSSLAAAMSRSSVIHMPLHHFRRKDPEPIGAGNGGITGYFVSIVFSIVIPFRAVPDLDRSA